MTTMVFWSKNSWDFAYILNIGKWDCWLAGKKYGGQLRGSLLDWTLKLNDDSIDNNSTVRMCLRGKKIRFKQNVYSKTVATDRRKNGKISKEKDICIRQTTSSSSEVILFQRDSKCVLSVWRVTILVCSLSRPSSPKEKKPTAAAYKNTLYLHAWQPCTVFEILYA